MTSRTSIILFVFILFPILREHPVLSQPLEILRTNQPMYIDGNLDEPAWQAAPDFTPFVFTWYESGTQEQTEAKMLWDDRFLYVAFTCTDAHIAGTRTARNDEVYKDDTVELFIAPNVRQPVTYMNYEINCLGTYLVGEHPDLKTKRRIEPSGLMIGRSHEGTINDESDSDAWWILEIAVPFENFRWTRLQIPPASGTLMRLNLNQLGGEVNPQLSQWKAGDPQKQSFHAPQYFGEVVLSSKTLP